MMNYLGTRGSAHDWLNLKINNGIEICKLCRPSFIWWHLKIDHLDNYSSNFLSLLACHCATTFEKDKPHDALRVSKSNGNDNEVFSLRSLPAISVFGHNRIFILDQNPKDDAWKEHAYTHVFYSEMAWMARVVTVNVFRHTLRRLEAAESLKYVLMKLRTRYEEASTGSPMYLFLSRISTRGRLRKDLGGYFVELKRYFN